LTLLTLLSRLIFLLFNSSHLVSLAICLTLLF